MKFMLWRISYIALTTLILIVGTLLYPLLRGWKYRDLLWRRLWPQGLARQPSLWFHAVSLGEAVILNSILERFSKKEVESFLITSSTLDGFETLNKRNWPSECCFLPFDHAFSLGKMFKDRVLPDLIVVETEIWPELFQFVTSHQRRILIFNARFGERTMRRSKNPLIRSSIHQVSRFLVRSEAEVMNLQAFAVPSSRVSVLGNIKFDYSNMQLKPDPFRSWLEEGSVIIFSSISNNEVPLLAPQLVKLAEKLPAFRFLWVPRHFGQLKSHIEALLTLEPVLREGEKVFNTRCVILNSIGELAGTYRFAEVSIIGGSFNKRGGQNFIESLSAGVPAITGPSMKNFQAELDLAIKERCVTQIQRSDDLMDTVLNLLQNQKELAVMKENARSLVQSNKGAIERTVLEIREFASFLDV